MLISSILINAEKKKFDESKKSQDDLDSFNVSMGSSSKSEKNKSPGKGSLLVTLFILVLEIAFLVYAVKLALACGNTTGQKALYVILALMFPIPAVIIFWVTGCSNVVE
jgi:hypothetical protein